MVDRSTQRPYQPFMSTPSAEALSDLNKELTGALSDVSQVYFEGMRELQSELFRFAAYRSDETSASGRNLLQAQQLSDLAELQQNWLRRFSEQYLSETDRILSLMQRTTESAWAPFVDYEKKFFKDTEEASNQSDPSCGKAKPIRKKSAARKP